MMSLLRVLSDGSTRLNSLSTAHRPTQLKALEESTACRKAVRMK